jgi:GMP synthase (glutamine-hydrolysing)
MLKLLYRNCFSIYVSIKLIIKDNTLKIQVLQHVPFEGPANIALWAKDNSHEINITRLYSSEGFPMQENFELLVVMGGPMGVYDEKKYSWMKKEKQFIEKCIFNNKLVLGICLGAQLIADVLGALVYKNLEKEIGFFNVSLTDEGCSSDIFKNLPSKLSAFHWHGDTFEIPSNAKHLTTSDACENQAFLYSDNVLGLQFHFESSAESIKTLIENCRDDLTSGMKYVTSEDKILKDAQKSSSELKSTLYTLLNNFTAKQ